MFNNSIMENCNILNRRSILNWCRHVDNYRSDYQCAYLERNVSLLNIENHLLTSIYGAHNIRIIGIGIPFNEVVTTPQEILTAIDKMKETYQEVFPSIPDEEDYTVAEIYINSISPDALVIPGFKPVENNAVDLVFHKARNNARNVTSRWDFPNDEEFIISKLYVSDDKHTVIRVLNYYNNFMSNRASELEYLNSYNLCVPESIILTAILPTLIPELKGVLVKEELELLKLFADPYNLNTLAVKNRLRAIYSLPIYKDIIRNAKVKKIKEAFKTKAVKRINTRINEVQEHISRLVQSIATEEETLANLNNELFVHNYKNTDIDDKLDYIMNHPYITQFNIGYSDNFELTARVPLSIWDLDVAEMVIKNLDKIFESNNVLERYRPLIRCFMQEVLVNQSAVYYMTSDFKINISDYCWSYGSHRNMDDTYFKTLLSDLQAGVNPHIEFYTCTGSHKVEINRAQSSKDLILLLETLLNPIKNWNLTDGAVVNRSMSLMFPALIDSDIKCIEYENEMYTIQEFYNKINTTEDTTEETVTIEEGDED